MTTSIDTNVLISLWDKDKTVNEAAEAALERAFLRGRLIVSGAVYAELLASPSLTVSFIDRFLEDTQIDVEWAIGESVWRVAGQAFKTYSRNRKKQTGSLPRRILADFLIGAHAQENGYTLLTSDKRIYRSSFPKLKIESL